MNSEVLLSKLRKPDTKLTIILILSGVVCVVGGTAAFAFPVSTARGIGYAFAVPGGKGEFMTFYGGFYAGIGIFLLLAARIRSLQTGAVAFLAVSASTAMLVRVYSLVQFEVSQPIFYELLLGEVLFVAAGCLGWYWTTQASEDRKTRTGIDSQ
jgi:hypothetical protein